jgi:phage antirepressor YoqD-like protein
LKEKEVTEKKALLPTKCISNGVGHFKVKEFSTNLAQQRGQEQLNTPIGNNQPHQTNHFIKDCINEFANLCNS